MLKRLGHNVRVLEQSTVSSRANTAAGMGIGPNAQEFLKTHDLLDQPIATHMDTPVYLDRDGKVKFRIKRPINLTSWDALYHRLRANFDGYKSSYCLDPPRDLPTDGQAIYDLGKRVTAATSYNGSATVAFDDLVNGGSGSYSCDLLIAADGSNSTIRRLLAPETSQEYVGYVAWRAVVPESEVTEETRKFYNNNFFTSILPGKLGYVLGYAIPGVNGTLEPGKRSCNVVWYTRLNRSSPEYTEALTDTDGVLHRSTIPKGKVQPKVWAKAVKSAASGMPSFCYEICSKAKEPFLSAINDCEAPRAVWHGGKVLLVGEALLLVRPHTGSSFDTAAFQVLQLRRALSDKHSLAQWEKNVLYNNRKVQQLTIAYGRFLIYGLFRPSFWLAVFNFLFTLLLAPLKNLIF
jgi:2-polyprenyl-6-methoxyphenol hydroxylase-like FAD-dependent oxidoreductase